MPIPKSLEALMDHGVVEQVVRPLLSGKEAEVYLVVSEGAYRVAKVYKEAHNRTFKNRATYTEGRKVRNSRDQRAMAKRTNHGKAKDEAAWRSTEVDMIYKLEAAGVRVPTPYHFVDGILIMELVQGADGEPAPRLGELQLTLADAKHVYDCLLAEVVRMLCAGVVHGDLSEFNVLMGQTGPCIIDFPQSVHAASNANARALLLRDVNNLHRFLERFAPGRHALPYGEEMWQLYEKGELTPTTQLTGKYTDSTKPAEVDVVMAIIEEAKRDERIRQQRLGGDDRGYGRKKATQSAAWQSEAPERLGQEQGVRGGHQAAGDRRPASEGAGLDSRATPSRRPAAHRGTSSDKRAADHAPRDATHLRPDDREARRGSSRDGRDHRAGRRGGPRGGPEGQMADVRPQTDVRSVDGNRRDAGAARSVDGNRRDAGAAHAIDGNRRDDASARSIDGNRRYDASAPSPGGNRRQQPSAPPGGGWRNSGPGEAGAAHRGQRSRSGPGGGQTAGRGERGRRSPGGQGAWNSGRSGCVAHGSEHGSRSPSHNNHGGHPTGGREGRPENLGGQGNVHHRHAPGQPGPKQHVSEPRSGHKPGGGGRGRPAPKPRGPDF